MESCGGAYGEAGGANTQLDPTRRAAGLLHQYGNWRIRGTTNLSDLDRFSDLERSENGLLVTFIPLPTYIHFNTTH